MIIVHDETAPDDALLTAFAVFRTICVIDTVYLHRPGEASCGNPPCFHALRVKPKVSNQVQTSTGARRPDVRQDRHVSLCKLADGNVVPVPYILVSEVLGKAKDEENLFTQSFWMMYARQATPTLVSSNLALRQPGRDLIGSRFLLGEATTGHLYNTANCSAQSDGHTLVECRSSAGVGVDFSYLLVVGGQATRFLPNYDLSYHEPVIHHVRPIYNPPDGTGRKHTTKGNEVVRVYGECFGASFDFNWHGRGEFTYAARGRRSYTALRDATLVTGEATYEPGKVRAEFWR